MEKRISTKQTKGVNILGKKTMWEKHMEALAIREYQDSNGDKLLIGEDGKIAVPRGIASHGTSAHDKRWQSKLLKIRKKKAAREKEILEMRLDKGYSLEEIARNLKPKVTRERVRQILLTIEKREGIEIAKPSMAGRRVEYISVVCLKCGRGDLLPRRLVHKFPDGTLKTEKEWCKQCGKPLKYKTLPRDEWKKLTEPEKRRWRYANDPEYKRMVALANKKAVAKLRMEHPEKYAIREEKAKGYVAKYLAKKKKEHPGPRAIKKMRLERARELLRNAGLLREE